MERFFCNGLNGQKSWGFDRVKGPGEREANARARNRYNPLYLPETT